MSSMVLEMKKKCLDSSESEGSLVRFAYAVASNLDDESTKTWISNEMTGYPEESQLPTYRVLNANIKAWNPSLGWTPVEIQEAPEVVDRIRKVFLRQPLSELVHLKASGNTVYFKFPEPLYQLLFAHQRSHVLGIRPYLSVEANAIVGVLETVRSRILEWSLKLSKNGVRGDNYEFSSREKEAALSSVFIQNFYVNGDLYRTENSSNVAIGTSGSSVVLNTTEGD